MRLAKPCDVDPHASHQEKEEAGILQCLSWIRLVDYQFPDGVEIVEGWEQPADCKAYEYASMMHHVQFSRVVLIS